MKGIKIFAMVFAVILVCTVTAQAQTDRPANYVVLKAGVYDPSNEFDLGNIHINSKTGFAGEVAIGRYFLPVLAFELGAGYFENRGTAAGQAGKTKLKVVPVVLTGKLLAQLGPVEPYAAGGIGAYLTEFDADASLGNINGNTKVTYGLHAGAGINFNIAPWFFLGAEGRYLWTEPKFGGQDIKLDGFTVTGDIGFRF